MGNPIIGLGPVKGEEKSIRRGVGKGEESINVKNSVSNVASLHETCLVRTDQVGSMCLRSGCQDGREDFEVGIR